MELPPAINRILEDQLSSFEFAFAVSDATAPDMPICFVSDKFLELTGYSREEVIGRNCRFLQGPETEKRKVMEIRDAIREDRCCQVCLTNYRKDGSKFLNQFFLSAVRDDQGIVTHYVGVQTDVSQLAGALAAPGQLQEQQAAVALGEAAGCRMCDVLMQPAEVVQQLQQLQQQQQQQPREVVTAASAAAASQQQQQQQQQDSDDENDVVREELRHAVQVNDVIQQSHPHAGGCLASSLLQPLLKIQQSFVLSDPRLPDCPIIHASEQFLQLTGYSREEVVGRNCRFLQRDDCDPAELQKLRDALAASPPRPVNVVLLNYTKAGRPFRNALHVAPVRDAAGQLQFFIGVQLDVSEAGRAGQGGDGSGKLHLSQRLAHMTTTGAVKVAVRGLSGEGGGLRRSLDHQGLPHRGYAARSGASCDGSGLRSPGSSRGSGLGGLAAAPNGDGAAAGGEAAPLAPAS